MGANNTRAGRSGTAAGADYRATATGEEHEPGVVAIDTADDDRLHRAA